MTVLVLAAESFPPEWDRYAQIAGAYFAVVGYAATLASFRSANRTFEGKLAQERQREHLFEQIVEATQHLQVVEETLNAAAPDDKYDVHQHFSRLRDERAQLERKALGLETDLISSAARSHFLADIMLLLTFLGVAGGAVLLIMQLFLVAPFVLAVSPGTYVAYRRLNNATKDASGMAHTERMRQLEYSEKKLELEEKRREITDRHEVRGIEAAERRIELMGKRHDLEAKIYHVDPSSSDRATASDD